VNFGHHTGCWRGKVCRRSQVHTSRHTSMRIPCGPRASMTFLPATAEEAPTKPFKPDPRMTFDTKTIRFYAFETSDDNAPQKPPDTVRGILDPLQDRTCDQITGRRKKEDTLKMNNMERLVGMDAPARPGDRVIISRCQLFPFVICVDISQDKSACRFAISPLSLRMACPSSPVPWLNSPRLFAQPVKGSSKAGVARSGNNH